MMILSLGGATLSDKRITLEDEYKLKFFQLPKVLFTNERYKDLSNNARVVYAMLRDRFDLSRKNNWIETNDEGNSVIYFVFTNEDLMELTHIKSKSTIATIKKDLEKVGLIEQKRLGVNKPNKIYLNHPTVTSEDMYEIDRLENYDYDMNKVSECHEGNGSPKIELPKLKNAETLGAQGSSIFGLPKIELHEVRKSNSSKTDNSETDFLKELDTINTVNTKTSLKNDNLINPTFTKEDKEQLRKKIMEQAFFENQNRISKRLATALQVFTDTTEQAERYYQTILIAKKKVEQELNCIIWLEHEAELEHEIINSFARVMRKVGKGANIDNLNGYLYTSIYELLSAEMSVRARIANQGDLPLYDWINES